MWSYHHLGLCLRAFLRASPVTLQQTGSFASFTPLRIKGNLQFQLQFHTDIQHISDQKSQKYGFSAKRRCNHTLQLSGLISSWVQVWLLYTGQFRGQRTGTEIHSALFDSFIVIWTSRQHTVQHCSPSTDVFWLEELFHCSYYWSVTLPVMYNWKQQLHTHWGLYVAPRMHWASQRSRPGHVPVCSLWWEPQRISESCLLELSLTHTQPQQHNEHNEFIFMQYTNTHVHMHTNKHSETCSALKSHTI